VCAGLLCSGDAERAAYIISITFYGGPKLRRRSLIWELLETDASILKHTQIAQISKGRVQICLVGRGGEAKDICRFSIQTLIYLDPIYIA
jgi:hypothetical protein